MKRLSSTLIVAAALSASSAARAAEFKLDGQTFTLPDGFTIEKVAGPGLVNRPIEGDFDEEGRLYVSDSSGSNDPVKKQLEEKPHRIMRLEDTNGDGVFDSAVVFADKLMFPEGTMWHDGSLYVSAPPVIWKLTDTNGDGVADKREEWVDAKTLTGCANDLHGPYMGLDGWIYWCKGAFASQTWDMANGKQFKTRAAHIFRRRAEGGPLEPVMTGGMDNPVEVAFTPEGERIFTTTFFQHPGGGKRDGLVHAVYGGVYGKIHDVLDDHPKTGDYMPVLTHLGPAAPCGLLRYESTALGEGYRDNLFACLFNLHKVTRHVLKPKGGTFESVDSDFLVSDSTDFHPTDVIEDADGSLLVINTGGWYKLCCPTSQLWKPDLLGAIYRVRRTDAEKIEDPRGKEIEWAELSARKLAALLHDERPAVVKRAVHALRKRSDAESALRSVLRGGAGERERKNAIWALTGAGKGAPVVREALQDKNATVRHAALQAISVMRDKGAAAGVANLLGDADAQVRRAAAEALGRIGSAQDVPRLLNAAGALNATEGSALPDRVLEHSIIYALIEIGAVNETRAGLATPNAFVQRAAFIALDQMENGKLTAGAVAPLFKSREPVLKETANWIVAHHADWGADLAEFLGNEIRSTEAGASERNELEQHLAGLAGATAIQELLVKTAGDASVPKPSRLLALNAIKNSRLKPTPEAWSRTAAELSSGSDMELAGAAVNAAATFSFKKIPDDLRAALSASAKSGALPVETRLQALSIAAAGAELDPSLFDFVRANLGTEKPFALRNLAAGVLSKAHLTDAQLLSLAENVKWAGPVDIAPLLGAFENSTSELAGRTLVASLKESRGLAGLTADRVKQLVAKYPESVREQAKAVEAMLNEDAARQAAHLDELLPKLKDGDIRRGQAVFNSAKTACVACHAIGYLGGNLGPDLTRIGQVRTERDLLEAIVYPSASFVRSYEPVIVTTRGGDEFSGVIRKDASDEIVLGTGPGAEVRIARADIATTRPGKTSVMPQGFGEQLDQRDLSDLLAFLKATR